MGGACMKLATNKDLNGMNAKRTLLNALARHIQDFNNVGDLFKILNFFVLHHFFNLWMQNHSFLFQDY